MPVDLGTLTIGGREYVVIPRDAYDRFLAGGELPGADEPAPRALALLGRRLRAARKHAGLTQVALAGKIGRAQGTVARAEAGKIQVSTGYARDVLRACRLPLTWTGPNGGGP